MLHSVYQPGLERLDEPVLEICFEGRSRVRGLIHA